MHIETSARNAMANAFGALFASGSTVKFVDASDSEVATLAMNATPFGTASNGKITANAITSDGSAEGGVIDHAELRNAASALVADLSVGLSGTDIIITTLTIAAGSTVSMSSLELTMPAGTVI